MNKKYSFLLLLLLLLSSCGQTPEQKREAKINQMIDEKKKEIKSLQEEREKIIEKAIEAFKAIGLNRKDVGSMISGGTASLLSADEKSMAQLLIDKVLSEEASKIFEKKIREVPKVHTMAAIHTLNEDITYNALRTAQDKGKNFTSFFGISTIHNETTYTNFVKKECIPTLVKEEKLTTEEAEKCNQVVVDILDLPTNYQSGSSAFLALRTWLADLNDSLFQEALIRSSISKLEKLQLQAPLNNKLK